MRASSTLGHTNYSGKRQKATTALFYLDPIKKTAAARHTLRLCEAQRVPIFWLKIG